MNEVDHPAHYNAHPSGIECIDVVEHMTFNLGNAVKYIWRAGLKSANADMDLQKAIWYLERERKKLANELALHDAMTPQVTRASKEAANNG